MYAEEAQVDSVNNRSLVNYGLNLHVAGHVESSGIKVGITDKSADLGYRYFGSGVHTLISNSKWIQHNEDGSGTAIFDWYWNSYIGNRSGSAALTLSKIQRAAQIKTFTGTSISDVFRATFDSVSGATEYRLRISIPNVIALQTFNNYISGGGAYLSQDAIDTARSHATGDTLTIAGTIETYVNGSKIGETQLTIPIKINNNIHIAINGQYKEAIPYVGVNGQWKEANPYIGVNSQWKEGI